MKQMLERTYHGLVLDPFQTEALAAIDAGKSVIVAAPTGTGKTLVADYLVEQAMQNKLRVIYTAPIKALSNQKFKDFKNEFGPEAVGIMTGDVVLNPAAPLLIMTTEIFRNQVITEDPNLALVSHIIFDEIHWLNDEERGTVWEESIILAPPHMKVLGLSATIANARQLVEWISSIRKEEVALIEEKERAVPLEYFYYSKDTGIVTYDKLWKFYRQQRKHALTENPFAKTTHLDLIKTIEGKYLPLLFFVFSRKQCAGNAKELARTANYLRPHQRRQVEEAFLNHFGPEENWSLSTSQLKRLCAKGIAFHHAGLLPVQKAIVEELFQERLIQVLYCTETFSVGINYPVKAVCFESLNKFDGRNFRPLANHEFFQMSGRAGRRGIDAKGYSFALIDFTWFEKNPPPRFQIDRLEPLASQFKLTYNTVLNLTSTLNYEQIRIFFQKSFAAYSSVLASAHINEHLALLSEKLSNTSVNGCEHVSTWHCPLKHYPKLKEFERLQRVYRSLGPRKQHRAYGKAMARKIQSWEKLLANPPQQCPASRQTVCRDETHSYQALKQEYQELEQTLAVLPGENSFLDEFEIKKGHLRQLGYLRENEVLPRGECAGRIYVQELLVTELIFSGIFADLDDDQLNALLSAVDFESRKNDFFHKVEILDWTDVKNLGRYLQSVCGQDAVRYDPRVAIITYQWSRGLSLTEVQKFCNLDEGDIISVFRRTIDLLRQMRDAVSDPVLRTRLKTCMDKLDRDEAAVLEL